MTTPEFKTEEELFKFIEENKSFYVRNRKCMFCKMKERKRLNFGSMSYWDTGYHTTCVDRELKKIRELKTK